MTDIDKKIAEITERAIRRVCDCRYEDDKIHIHIHHAIQEVRVLFQDQIEQRTKEACFEKAWEWFETLFVWDNIVPRGNEDLKKRFKQAIDSVGVTHAPN